MVQGQKVKIIAPGKHSIPGMEELIGREFYIQKVSSIQELNPTWARHNNVKYKLYALFRFTNGAQGYAWFDECALEVVE